MVEIIIKPWHRSMPRSDRNAEWYSKWDKHIISQLFMIPCHHLQIHYRTQQLCTELRAFCLFIRIHIYVHTHIYTYTYNKKYIYIYFIYLYLYTYIDTYIYMYIDIGGMWRDHLAATAILLSCFFLMGCAHCSSYTESMYSFKIDRLQTFKELVKVKRT